MAAYPEPTDLKQPELILVIKKGVDVNQPQGGPLESPTTDVGPVNNALSKYGASASLLFGPSQERVRRGARELPPSSDDDQYDLAAFYRVNAPLENLEDLARDLVAAQDVVDAAYVKPPAMPAIFSSEPTSTDAPPITPNFVNSQGYLNSAPGGIGAITDPSDPTGQGRDIRVIDCEWGWRLTHEDLREVQGGVIAGTNSNDTAFVNHGTAVAGVIGGDQNTFGITGIAPRAMFFTSSFVGQSTSVAIAKATDKLRPGDIILIEAHRAGPKSNGQGQFGFIPLEWWPDDFIAIRRATRQGIIVVEAAGNGTQNLDDQIYNVRPSNFPPWWRNPFNQASPSSDAVMVGAGAPPPGTHGKNYGPDRSRLSFSNYGTRVDAQGWGMEVTTTGYGDLQGGPDPDLWYTAIFNGTSSASPIVTGALASVQGTLKGNNRPLLTPARARHILRITGSPQQDGLSGPASQRIGNRPDIRQLITVA
jgi:hypothetical protein